MTMISGGCGVPVKEVGWEGVGFQLCFLPTNKFIRRQMCPKKPTSIESQEPLTS